LIVGALPSLLALAAMLFQRERLSRRGWLAVGASTLGVLWIVGLPELGHGWLGDALVFLSLLTTVSWVLLSKRLSQKYNALTVTTFILTFGALTLLPVSLLWDGLARLQMSGNVWASILALGLLCTALTFGLWNWALERIPASRAGLFVNLQPLVGAGLRVMVLHESLSLSVLVGGLLVITAAWIISQPELETVQVLESA
jgi:drug/metabolite transporter (DMT)-like permease